MKLLNFALSLTVIFSLCMSCNKDDEMESANQYDCEFVQNDDNMDGIIDDNEKSLMMDCLENEFSSKSEIESNLIGEWELVGHGEGWIPTVSQPCGYITFSENELTFEFENAFTDTITTHTWEIIENQSGNFYYLQVDPGLVQGLWLTTFCEEYMYSDSTPADGNMYLYKKVN